MVAVSYLHANTLLDHVHRLRRRVWWRESSLKWTRWRLDKATADVDNAARELRSLASIITARVDAVYAADRPTRGAEPEWTVLLRRWAEGERVPYQPASSTRGTEDPN
jgi:hypothetical protein